MESQNQTILNHLKTHKQITSWEAIQKYHITRLSARIFDLKEKGYDIRSISERDENNNPYARYVLIRSKRWSVEDLCNLPKEKFTGKFEVSDEEYEMLQKEIQEM